MLAVQRPSMGSSKPPNLEMPFGYSFDDQTSNFPFPSPTAPAPGPSLLDDNESKFLESFFDGVSTDNFNYDFYSNAPDGSGLGLRWEELPPAFMGTSSSFSQQPQIGSTALPDTLFNNIHPHVSNGPPLIPPPPSADVLAAANLLQNGSSIRSQSVNNEVLFRGQDNPLQSTNGQMRANSVSQYPPARSNTVQERPASDDFMRDTFYTEMMFGNQGQPARVAPKVDLHWGSDSGFGHPQGFVPPTSQEKVLSTDHYQKIVDNALVGQSSAESTRASSPVCVSPNQRTKSGGRAKDEDDESRPRKRRKSKFEEEGGDDDDDSPASATYKVGGKKRKSIKKGSSNESPATSDPNQKRRKSTAAANAAAKTARENLTEDQKRENHIKSEQKRRTLIREGFEDLGELVPGLRGGGFSKSAVLIMTADWLEDLIQGNDVLRRRLDSLQAPRG